MNGSVMNVVCFEWSVMMTTVWFERTPFKIELYNCASLLQQIFWEKDACLFFYFLIALKSLKSAMPYPRSGVTETGCALLGDDFSI